MQTPQQVLDDPAMVALGTRLLAAARVAETVAQRSGGKLRLVWLLGLLAAAWLGWRLQARLDLSLPMAAIVLLVLALPALLLRKLQAMLTGVIGLPQRVIATFGEVQGTLLQLQQQMLADEPVIKRRPKLRDLLDFGRAIIEARALGARARGVVGALGGAAFVANPGFLVAVLASTGVVLALTAIAALSVLVYLL
jgi:hypothetical protein